MVPQDRKEREWIAQLWEEEKRKVQRRAPRASIDPLRTMAVGDAMAWHGMVQT